MSRNGSIAGELSEQCIQAFDRQFAREIRPTLCIGKDAWTLSYCEIHHIPWPTSRLVSRHHAVGVLWFLSHVWCSENGHSADMEHASMEAVGQQQSESKLGVMSGCSHGSPRVKCRSPTPALAWFGIKAPPMVLG